jgi:hypothetical protein
MQKYYLNKKPLLDGSYSVHKEGCPFIADTDQRIYLGKFNSCLEAVRTARVICTPSDGCYFCCMSCSEINIQMQQGGRVPGYPICFFSEN